MRLVEVLDEHDDAQNVYANFDISDEIAAQLEEQCVNSSKRAYMSGY